MNLETDQKSDKDRELDEFLYTNEEVSNCNKSILRPSIASRSDGKKSIPNIFKDFSFGWDEFVEADRKSSKIAESDDYEKVIYEQNDTYSYEEMKRFAHMFHYSLEMMKDDKNETPLKQYSEYMVYICKEIRSACKEADEIKQSIVLNYLKKTRFEELKEIFKKYTILYALLNSDKQTNWILGKV